MAKVKLTKNEYKKQKDALKRFLRYLPMLQLKKQQLQAQMLKIIREGSVIREEIEKLRNEVTVWVDVFAQEVGFDRILKAERIETTAGNIAGIDIPIFSKVVFKQEAYDFMFTPLWVDMAVKAVKEMTALKARLQVNHRQIEVLRRELRVVTQRVNLFEKVKIPAAQENIRIIQIYLGDEQTAEVVRGKIAKAKIEKRLSLN